MTAGSLPCIDYRVTWALQRVQGPGAIGEQQQHGGGQGAKGGEGAMYHELGATAATHWWACTGPWGPAPQLQAQE